MENAYHITKAKQFTDAALAVDYIDFLYKESCERIKSAFQGLLNGKSDEAAMQQATYPFVGIKVTNQDLHVDVRLSFGVVSDPGYYGSTVTRTDIFKNYYILLKYFKIFLYYFSFLFL